MYREVTLNKRKVFLTLNALLLSMLFCLPSAWADDDVSPWIFSARAIAKGAAITAADVKVVSMKDDDVKLADHPNKVLHQPVTATNLVINQVAARAIPAGKIFQQADIVWFVNLHNSTEQKSAAVASKAPWYNYVRAARSIIDETSSKITPESARTALANIDKAYDLIIAMPPASLKAMDAESRVRLSALNPGCDYSSVGIVFFGADMKSLSVEKATYNLLKMKQNGLTKQTNLYKKFYESFGPKSSVTRICYNSMNIATESLKRTNDDYKEQLNTK